MKNLPALKVYEIDYDFIIKNYLDTKLWGVTWNVFMYDDFVYELKMRSIDVQDNTISFGVVLRNVFNGKRQSTTFDYNVANSNIHMLKKSLHGAMITATRYYERFNIIQESKEYNLILASFKTEENKLIDIAREFLNKNNVTNSEIRDAYIEKYVFDNSRCDVMKDNYLDANEYCHLTDLFLMLANVTERKSLKESVAEKCDEERINEIMLEVEEAMKYMETEEWVDEKTDCLERI